MAATGVSRTLELGSELRGAPRKKTFLSGKLTWDGGTRSCECTIRNSSVSGVRVDIDDAQIVPKQLFLIDMRSAMAYDCELKWRAKGALGLRFLRSIALEGEVPAELRYLKQMWCYSSLAGDPELGMAVRTDSAATTTEPWHVLKMPEVTAEMIGAGVTAYTAWKPADVAWRRTEPDMVRSVFIAMIRAMRK